MKIPTSRLLLASALLLGGAAGLQAQPTDPGAAVRYNVAFPNAVHHEARITATFAGVPAGQTLHVRMARSSPGRYATHDFAKNVYYVLATDGADKPLPTTKPDPYGWDVTAGADGTVRFNYTLYGDRTDGTYVGIDQQHAHLNMPATLCYAREQANRAAVVHFEVPPTWKVATQLRPDAGGDKNTYTAPNLHYLMDSPTSLGVQQERAWQEGDKKFEINALHAGLNTELDEFMKGTQKLVREEIGVWGELPKFDFDRYTFVVNLLPQASGDGMEHRNSTSITNPTPLRGDEGQVQNLGIVAHEFFHAWNVERLRPKSLEPFDFDRPNMSDELWFAEGFTQYYGDLALCRAGIIDEDNFYERLSGYVNARQNSPGARYASAVDMSRQAVFADAAVSIDPTNRSNTYLSYYLQGAGLALSLDMQLRATKRTDLDALMRAMWAQFGKNQKDYAPAAPYTVKDFQRVLGEVAKDTAFASRFVRQYVTGREAPRFADNLMAAGLVVKPTHVLGAALPRQVRFENGQCLVANATQINSGLYRAGLDRGDVLLALDGQTLTDAATLDAIMRRHSPADMVLVKVRTRGGIERTAQLVLTEDPNVEVVPGEIVQTFNLTQPQKDVRANWLASRATPPNVPLPKNVKLKPITAPSAGVRPAAKKK
ncbi:M61 family metallopeptidase [uncultured Hymenobacter sp.]|uniref:M61 family metallopeptidase n=1 Tax=uncultured Hymenobacter sp. TaxID=170016 RepID=UPI0035CA48DB